MKTFSPVSATLLSDTAIASPLRAHRGLNRPDTMILLHLASRLNPVNGIWGIGNPVHGDEVARLRAFLRPKLGRTVWSATTCQRISQLLLHCCNTRHAIEVESTFK